MPTWLGDFANASMDEVVRYQAENRGWYKEIRLKNNELVNRKLAKHISPEEYAVHRKEIKEHEAECRRRGDLLLNEIVSRSQLSLR
jgi:hypothetical protein